MHTCTCAFHRHGKWTHFTWHMYVCMSTQKAVADNSSELSLGFCYDDGNSSNGSKLTTETCASNLVCEHTYTYTTTVKCDSLDDNGECQRFSNYSKDVWQRRVWCLESVSFTCDRLRAVIERASNKVLKQVNITVIIIFLNW